MTLNNYIIREAIIEDLPHLLEIFNERIMNSTCIFAYDTISIQNRVEWMNDLKSKGYPIIVAAENISNKAVAYAYLGIFRPHPAYVLTSEISLYIHKNHQRKGLGALMLQEMLRIGREMRFRCIIASITADNEGSILLFSKFNFRSVGTAHDSGYKFGKFLDVFFMEYLTNNEVILDGNLIPSFEKFPWGNYRFGQNLYSK